MARDVERRCGRLTCFSFLRERCTTCRRGSVLSNSPAASFGGERRCSRSFERRGCRGVKRRFHARALPSTLVQLARALSQHPRSAQSSALVELARGRLTPCNSPRWLLCDNARRRLIDNHFACLIKKFNQHALSKFR